MPCQFTFFEVSESSSSSSGLFAQDGDLAAFICVFDISSGGPSFVLDRSETIPFPGILAPVKSHPF